MAPEPRSTLAPARKAAEAKPTKCTLEASQVYDSDSKEISERPTKRTRIGHKEEAHALTMGTDASRQAVMNTNELLRFESFDNSPPSSLWQQVTTVTLSTHLKVLYHGEKYGDVMTEITRAYVALELLCSLFLDTYISSPPCYNFEFHLEFKFEPAIPRYGYLKVSCVRFRTWQALKLGEAVDRAMAIRTDAVLCKDFREGTAEFEKYKKVTVTAIINELSSSTSAPRSFRRIRS